ncbi:MAG: ParB/RepB/Spo0J family partition protein [Spirochaetaceae bacterium]|nr:ParB/RepB/Spo0J family partition protein [Spirochaetaceae bacterium]
MAKQESRLGKGLDALFEDAADDYGSPDTASAPAANTGSSAGTPVMLDVSKLKPNPFQPRTEFNDEALEELAESIKLHGVIQPILVEDAGDGTYYIIAGERRTRAAKKAGLEQIPVVFQTFSDEKKLEVALIENIQRENLNPIEEARAYQQLMQLSNLSQEEAAQRVGKKRSTVANALRLLKLPEDMLNAVAAGTISAGHARALLSVSNPSDQRILFARITGSNMSVREAEQYAAELNGEKVQSAKKPKQPEKPKDPDISFIEQQFLIALGTKVTLKGSLEKGTIQIDYFSRQDLDRLYEIFVKEK